MRIKSCHQGTSHQCSSCHLSSSPHHLQDIQGIALYSGCTFGQWQMGLCQLTAYTRMRGDLITVNGLIESNGMWSNNAQGRGGFRAKWPAPREPFKPPHNCALASRDTNYDAEEPAPSGVSCMNRHIQGRKLGDKYFFPELLQFA